MSNYDHRTIEEKWRKRWLESGVYQPDLEKAKKSFYNLMMFPYPSAEGLHVGNMYAFTGADVYGRYQRMQGYDVFEPIGLDGFGIHSENYAIKVGKHPQEQALISQKRFYNQLSRIGAGYAWDNKLETYDPEYYRWTQWLFVQMFKRGLAYRDTAMVNWCPSCKTVLADEQVEDGLCERCKTEVTRKEMEQWFFRITSHADRLLDNIKKIDWPEKIKTAQRNWIGKSEGVEAEFKIQNSESKIKVFTTAQSTIFGVTFMVVAPEHHLMDEIVSGVPDEGQKKQVVDYIAQSLKKSEQDRRQAEKDKTGVFTGVYALHPFTGKEVPIWVADYVLLDYGTGAVMGVPGHDERDHAFAVKYDLPIQPVIRPTQTADGDEVGEDGFWSFGIIKESFAGLSEVFNSDFLDSLTADAAQDRVADELEKKGLGKRVANYHLRDWLISRQRYWGPPIPMVYCEACAKRGKSWVSENKGENSESRIQNSESSNDWHHGWYPVREQDLPVRLPFIEDYKPKGDGSAPLDNAPEEWLYVECPECGGEARRETDVSDTFLDSAWYFLRYPSVGGEAREKSRDLPQAQHDPGIEKEVVSELPWNPEITKKWLPVNAYIGGAEHAVLHLLYARFVTQALHDWGYVDFEEPFPFLYSHGLIIKDGAKMSKSRGNVVNPDEYIEKYGADTLRLYLMFLGKYKQGGDFRDSGIAGMYRFVNRVWDTFEDEHKFGDKTSEALRVELARTVDKMGRDIAKFKYNTAISALMELFNAWRSDGAVMSREDAVKVVKLLAPLAPFMAEELWNRLGQSQKDEAGDADKPGKESVHVQAWPTGEAVAEAVVTVVVQVNGKVRATMEMAADDEMAEEQVCQQAREHDQVAGWLEGKTVRKTIWVAPKGGRQGLVNFVVG